MKTGVVSFFGKDVIDESVVRVTADGAGHRRPPTAVNRCNRSMNLDRGDEAVSDGIHSRSANASVGFCSFMRNHQG
jgi:hypothetical protein